MTKCRHWERRSEGLVVTVTDGQIGENGLPERRRTVWIDDVRRWTRWTTGWQPIAPDRLKNEDKKNCREIATVLRGHDCPRESERERERDREREEREGRERETTRVRGGREIERARERESERARERESERARER